VRNFSAVSPKLSGSYFGTAFITSPKEKILVWRYARSVPEFIKQGLI